MYFTTTNNYPSVIKHGRFDFYKAIFCVIELQFLVFLVNGLIPHRALHRLLCVSIVEHWACCQVTLLFVFLWCATLSHCLSLIFPFFRICTFLLFASLVVIGCYFWIQSFYYYLTFTLSAHTENTFYTVVTSVTFHFFNLHWSENEYLRPWLHFILLFVAMHL